MTKERVIVEKASFSLALIEVDMDASAERLAVIDRRSLVTLSCLSRPPSGIAKALLPLEYATAGYLMVGIIDDDGEYDCKFTDGVQCQVVQNDTVDMSQ